MSDDPDADAVMAAFDKQETSSTGDPDASAVIDHFNTAESKPDGLKRQLGLGARAVIQGVSAIPMMAMNAGVAGRNIVGNAVNKLMGRPPTPNYQMPSEMLSQSLDQYLPHPEGFGENLTGGIESGLTGAGIAPTSGIKIPGNFQTAVETEKAAGRAAIERGHQAGLVVPPSTTNPTSTNKTLESISGKIATQQAASLKNQPIINSLAKQSLGLNPDAPLTPEAISYIKSQASNDYENIRGAGMINMPGTFKTAIQGTLKKFNSTADELPSLADKDLQPIADELTSRDQFSADALLGAIRSLRTKADMAFRAGNGGTGSAYKQMAGHIENAVDSDLSGRGPEFEDLVANFRDARQRIAIANTVEDAFNPSTGNVVAQKLAAALKRGVPLSGPLRTIAEFAQSAPHAVKEPTSSAVSHLDIGVPALTGLIGKSIPEKISGFALPLARSAARKYLLGSRGQASALPQVGANQTNLPMTVRGMPGGLAAMLQPPEAQNDER